MADYRARAFAGLMKDYPGSDNAYESKKTSNALKKTFEKVMVDYGKIRTLDDLLKSPAVTDFILKSQGLDPSLYNKETLKKIFTSDPKDKRNFLDNRIKRKEDREVLKRIVEDFNFDGKGDLTRAKEGKNEGKTAEERMHQGYLQQSLEESQGEQNEGVRLALYFKRKAPNVKSTYDLLSDRALYKVIETLFNFPPQMAGMDVKKKKEMIERRLSVKDLQDPAKLDQILRRFTGAWDAKNRQDTPSLAIVKAGSKPAGLRR